MSNTGLKINLIGETLNQQKVQFIIENKGLTPKQIQIIDAIQQNDLRKFEAIGLVEDLSFIINDDLIFPLFMVSILGRTQILEIMLRNPRLNVNQKDKYGINAFWIAAFYGQNEIIKIFYHTIIDKMCLNNNGSNALHIAVKRQHYDTVKLLIDLKFPLNQAKYNDVTELGIAAHTGNVNIVKLLVESGSQINIVTKQGLGALNIALKADHSECIAYLTYMKAHIYHQDPAKVEYSPIFYAIQNKLDRGLEVMLKNTNVKIDDFISKERSTTIHFAYKYGSNSVMAVLLPRIQNIQQEDQYKLTLFMKSVVDKNDVDLANIILKNGADINHRNSNGDTTLHYAILKKNIRAIKFLLEKQAFPHYENINGKDCCDLAKEFGIRDFPELNSCIQHKRVTNRKGSPVRTTPNIQTAEQQRKSIAQNVKQQQESYVNRSFQKNQESVRQSIQNNKVQKSYIQLRPFPKFEAMPPLQVETKIKLEEPIKLPNIYDENDRVEMIKIQQELSNKMNQYNEFINDTTNNQEKLKNIENEIDRTIDRVIGGYTIEKQLNQNLFLNIDNDQKRRQDQSSLLKLRREQERERLKEDRIKKRKLIEQEILNTTQIEKENLDKKQDKQLNQSDKIFQDKLSKYYNKLNNVFEQTSRFRTYSNPKQTKNDGLDYYITRHKELQDSYYEFNRRTQDQGLRKSQSHARMNRSITNQFGVKQSQIKNQIEKMFIMTSPNKEHSKFYDDTMKKSMLKEEYESVRNIKKNAILSELEKLDINDTINQNNQLLDKMRNQPESSMSRNYYTQRKTSYNPTVDQNVEIGSPRQSFKSPALHRRTIQSRVHNDFPSLNQTNIHIPLKAINQEFGKPGQRKFEGIRDLLQNKRLQDLDTSKVPQDTLSTMPRKFSTGRQIPLLLDDNDYNSQFLLNPRIK